MTKDAQISIIKQLLILWYTRDPVFPLSQPTFKSNASLNINFTDKITDNVIPRW